MEEQALMPVKLNDEIAFFEKLGARHLVNVFNHIKDYALIGSGRNGNIMFWSKAAERITGYKSEEVKGRKINILFTHHECDNGVPENILKCAAIEEHGDYNGWLVKESGEQFWANIDFIAVKDSNDHTTGFAVLLADKLHTKNLTETKLSKFMAEVEDYAISTMDLHGVIQNWNIGGEKLKGYTAKEIIGKNFKTFYTEKDISNKRPENLLAVAFKEGRVMDESWLVRKDGKSFWANVTITAIHDDDQSIIGYSVVTRDRSEKKAAEEKLKRHAKQIDVKNKEIEQFVFITSHDLQEPLRTVTALIDIIQNKYADKLDDMGKQCVRFTLDATDRMKRLIKDLLDYSRLGKKSPFVMLDCNLVVRTVLQDLNIVISEMKASFYVEPLPVITGKETEIRLLFQNLITNALKFRKPDVPPVISITAVKEEEHKWRFAIQDNGIGIEEKNHEKIFLIFQRIHTKTAYEGNGIGLAHCEKIIKMHNGKIWVESVLGEGSTFYFTLYDNLI